MPVSEIQQRILRFFLLVDCSSSMLGAKIASLNHAIREAIPCIQDASQRNAHITVEMRVIRFSNNAEWHVGPAPLPLEKFRWADVTADGLTATAQALTLLADQLTTEKMPRRGVPPVCILLSDGYCTDSAADYDAAIQKIKSLPWGSKSVRLAIGIGQPGEYDEQKLLSFVSHAEIGVLPATSPERLVHHIIWASVAATGAASQGKSSTGTGHGATSVQLSPPSADDVTQPVSIPGVVDPRQLF
jgi:uncharacterized protein YegL